MATSMDNLSIGYAIALILQALPESPNLDIRVSRYEVSGGEQFQLDVHHSSGNVQSITYNVKTTDTPNSVTQALTEGILSSVNHGCPYACRSQIP